ncbi:uroplakin-2 [Narcine bancroftii]|uniref:uroplakin-2 n=1 Tax=Narcine bancroftii TaxID=1343680 RepID=UPI003831AB77
MRLLILLALVSITGAADFTISLVDEAQSRILGNIRAESAIVTLPPCNFADKSVSVMVTNMTGQPGPVQPNFTMPFCRFKRGLVNIVSNTDGFQRSFLMGFRVKGLEENSEYNITSYVENKKSNTLTIKTIMPTNYQNINTSFGRSGAMIVITVLLVIAMAILIVLFIVALFIRK